MTTNMTNEVLVAGGRVAMRAIRPREVAASMADLMRDVARFHGAVVSAGLIARINDTLRDWETAGGAAAVVKTWRERIGAGEDFPMHVPSCVERAMMNEIAELRGQLVQAGQPEMNVALIEAEKTLNKR